MIKGTLVAFLSLSVALTAYAAPVPSPVAMAVPEAMPIAAAPVIAVEALKEREAEAAVVEILERVCHH